MNAFAKGMIAQRHRDKARRAPRGFDILLADVISQFKLERDGIEKLGIMTSKNQIAHAVVGNRTYYRRETIERLFPKPVRKFVAAAATATLVAQAIVPNYDGE